MENKINIACFKEGSRTAEVKGIWQWDYGQILRIQELNLPTAVEIHFSLDEHGGEAARRIGVTKDGVTDVPIPDLMVENESAYGDSYYFFAYIYLTDETSGNTEYKIRAKVSTRSRPEGYVSGGNDTFAEILKTVNEIAEDKVDIPVPAKVGQVIAVSEVDEDGRPTGFEATDQGGGVSDEKIAEAVGTYMESYPIEESDPTVPDWAKQPEKPSYTAEEVGALPDTTKIPSKTSDLQNDSKFTTLALDETLTDNTKAAPAGMVGELKGDIGQLSEEMEQLKQGGTGTENVESRLKGHTMGVIGDSLSDRSRGVTQWFDWIASRAGGMNLSLDCVSGRRLMQFPSDGLSNQCDIICVFGGTNDFNSAQELGTLDTANTDGKTTFYGAVYTLATELMTNYPKSVIIFITPLSSAPAYNSAENYKWYEYPSMGGHTMKDFCDAIKEVCCYLHIPVVDLFENSGLNYNYDTDNIYFVSDKLHLTDAGQEAISYVIEKKILEHYIPDNANVTEVVILSSISAEFTQGDSLYYPSSSLSDLKESLVVSAYYSDGTSNVITDYSLSGTLTEGTSTITVNYLGKTATFEVTVLAEGASEPFIVTLIPDMTLRSGFYYENDFETLATISPTAIPISCIYSEPVSIAGYNKIERDPDNVTYNWIKIAKVEEDGTITGGCLIVYYDKDMNIISGEANYNEYNTPNVSAFIRTGLSLKNGGTIPDEAVYFRALLDSSSTTTNTLKIT